MLTSVARIGLGVSKWVPKANTVSGALTKRFAHSVEEASFTIDPCDLHALDEGPKTECSLTRADALQYYKDMVVIRRMETAAANLYKEKAIRGFCHLCSGQEAIYVGMLAALREQDTVITSYRAHGFTYCMGVPVLGVLAELTGRSSGCVRGKGGSMHMYAKNFFGGNGIVGAQVPLGAGIGFASRYLGNGGVNFALYGDGAANQGQVFEAYNIAKLWNIPVVFVCENNGYGMGTSQDRAAASTEFYKRGDYIPGVKVNGMDFLSVREATEFALDYCGVQDKGPLVFEMATYRYHGHSMSDPGTSYRTRDEIQEMRQTRDPILGFKEKIVAAGLVDADELKQMEQEIRKSVDADVKKAKSDPEIGVEELYYDVYENNLEGKLRGLLPWEKHEHKKTQKALNL
eukprot:10882.XXX_102292_103755_1 [CDS] Oithona nana genome sequencing.